MNVLQPSGKISNRGAAASASHLTSHIMRIFCVMLVSGVEQTRTPHPQWQRRPGNRLSGGGGIHIPPPRRQSEKALPFRITPSSNASHQNTAAVTAACCHPAAAMPARMKAKAAARRRRREETALDLLPVDLVRLVHAIRAQQQPVLAHTSADVFAIATRGGNIASIGTSPCDTTSISSSRTHRSCSAFYFTARPGGCSS